MTFKSDFHHHPTHYISLVIIFIIGFIAFTSLSYYPAFQLVTIMLLSGSYVLWGIIHHGLHHDLHPKIVAEYLLVAMFAILIFSTLLYRA